MFHTSVPQPRVGHSSFPLGTLPQQEGKGCIKVSAACVAPQSQCPSKMWSHVEPVLDGCASRPGG